MCPQVLECLNTMGLKAISSGQDSDVEVCSAQTLACMCMYDLYRKVNVGADLVKVAHFAQQRATGCNKPLGSNNVMKSMNR